MNSALSGEAESTNTQYSGAAIEGPAANTAILATSGPQQPQVHGSTTAAVPALGGVQARLPCLPVGHVHDELLCRIEIPPEIIENRDHFGRFLAETFLRLDHRVSFVVD